MKVLISPHLSRSLPQPHGPRHGLASGPWLLRLLRPRMLFLQMSTWLPPSFTSLRPWPNCCFSVRPSCPHSRSLQPLPPCLPYSSPCPFPMAVTTSWPSVSSWSPVPSLSGMSAPRGQNFLSVWFSRVYNSAWHTEVLNKYLLND